MTISAITRYLESVAPPSLQESYDNAGLITGQPHWICTGVICCLDAIETVIEEAIANKCNLVVAHHPILFSGLKKINGNNYVERAVIKAIKNDIAIYAIHTNLDNIMGGVNHMIASKLGLQQLEILSPRGQQLKKLFFFVPEEHAENVMGALFEAGAGNIGNYSECSFLVGGTGTFRPNEAANPFSGEAGKRHEAEELKIEVLFPSWLESSVIKTLKANHPYEEVAYEVLSLDNLHQHLGAGMTGILPEPMEENQFLAFLKEVLGLSVIKHTAFTGKLLQKVALCGGAGFFLLKDAINSESDVYITSDVKYHEFFDADGRILLADVGHYESEQFTIELLATLLEEKFPNFAVLKTGVITNPVHYYISK